MKYCENLFKLTIKSLKESTSRRYYLRKLNASVLEQYSVLKYEQYHLCKPMVGFAKRELVECTLKASSVLLSPYTLTCMQLWLYFGKRNTAQFAA